MEKVKTNAKRLSDGIAIKTYSQIISSANSLEVEAGTTGYMGGDSGHGGRTYFRIEDLGSTDIRPVCFENKFGNKGIEVTLGGDCELDTVIKALEFIVDTLKKRIAGDTDEQCDDDTRSDKYKTILRNDAYRRLREYCLNKSNLSTLDFIDYEEFVNWCWEHNAGHWPDGTPICDD